jgi:precorrin-6B methylase 2
MTKRSIREWNLIYHYILLTNGNIAEIGAHKGDTTILMATNFPNKTIYAIDYTGGITMSKDQQHEKPLIIAERATHMPNVTIIDHNSRTLDFNKLNNVTTFFIDGDHSYEGVKSDTENAIKYLKSHNGGYILMHDYRLDNKYPWMGVRKYVDEELSKYQVIKPPNTVLVIFKI